MMRKHYADTRWGQIHYVAAGDGPAVLLLHQTPRSWDEYRDVIPLLAKNFRVVAVDTLGFGSSDTPGVPWSIELFADGIEDLSEALGLERCAFVGHHTGGVVAMEAAARRPGLVSALVLSGVPYVDAGRRERVSCRPSIDGVPLSNDGSHYQRLWNKRAPYYPTDRPDLLRRLVADGVRVGSRIEEGHLAVNAYRMEDRIGRVSSRTLVLCGELDEHSLPDVSRLLEALPNDTESVILRGVGVSSVDHDPEQFSQVVSDFLRRNQ